MYAPVLSRDGVWIGLILESLNGLDVKFVNVQNAYLNEKIKEKLWFPYSQEFGVHKCRLVVVIRALCGMKGYLSAWASELRKLTRDWGFSLHISGGYVWTRVAIDTLDIGAANNGGLAVVERYY